eukprot:3045838-Prymnesium_polylepis.1
MERPGLFVPERRVAFGIPHHDVRPRASSHQRDVDLQGGRLVGLQIPRRIVPEVRGVPVPIGAIDEGG